MGQSSGLICLMVSSLSGRSDGGVWSGSCPVPDLPVLWDESDEDWPPPGFSSGLRPQLSDKKGQAAEAGPVPDGRRRPVPEQSPVYGNWTGHGKCLCSPALEETKFSYILRSGLPGPDGFRIMASGLPVPGRTEICSYLPVLFCRENVFLYGNHPWTDACLLFLFLACGSRSSCFLTETAACGFS